MNGFLKFVLNLMVLASVTFSVYYALSPNFKVAVSDILHHKCESSIKYKIGTIDSKFSFTQDKVLADAKAAAEIWNKLYTKNLLEYSPTANLTINFVYDQRTSLNDQINQMEVDLSDKTLTYKQKVSAYETKAKSLNKKMSDYNNKVAYYNNKGGAPKDIYEELVSQGKELQKETDRLNSQAKTLHLEVNKYTIEAQKYNQNITEFNEELSSKPEEGSYDPNNNMITIYFANDHNELIHTLAHEFGHTLGLGHNSNQKSIMYTYTSESILPTVEDKSDLMSLCNK